jgi:hypothetical protein
MRFPLLSRAEVPGVALAALDVYPTVTFRDVEVALTFTFAAFWLSISDVE